MKKALSAFAVLIALGIVLMLGAVYYLTGFSFPDALAKLLAVWTAVLNFAVVAPWLLPKIIVVALLGLIVIVDFIILFKIMQLRKPFVSYLTFINIIFVALIAVLAFIEYPAGTTGSTLVSVITAHIMAPVAPVTAMHGYILLGTIGFFALCNLIFIILSFVDIAKTPFPLKRTKKEKGKKAKRKTDRDVVADEFGKFQVPVQENIPPASPSIQEIRHAVKEELHATQAPRQPEPAPARAPEPIPATGKPLTLEEIRSIIRDELERSGRGGFDSFRGAPVIYAAPWIGGYPYPAYPPQQPAYYPPQQPQVPGVTGASKEDIRNAISQELEKTVPSKKEIVTLIEQEVARLSPTNKEAVYSIVNEELIKYDALNREALDSLVTEKVDKYDAMNKALIKSQLSEEISKYDAENRQAIRAIFAEELQKYDTANKEILHSIIDEELAKKTVVIDQAHDKKLHEAVAQSQATIKQLLEEQMINKEAEVKQFIVQEIQTAAGPGAEDMRAVFAEEISRFAASKEASKPEEKVHVSEVTFEQVKNIVAQEIAKVDVPQSDELRIIFAEEIARFIKKQETATPPVKSEPLVEPTPVIREVVSPFAKSEEVMPEIKIEPKIEPKATPKPKPAPTPVVIDDEADDEDEEGGNKQPIIRIPFQTRMKHAEKELLTNFNTLKNYLLSYGIKSRVSNSGDTFRLHRETFVKITIAGKGLKLYYALNPKDYENSTIPVQNVSHKALYADIPCVLKVKSPLSVKRAMQLIDDLMQLKGLEQGDILKINWARDFK